LHLNDNEQATFGNSNDLRLYHDEDNSYIDDSGTGGLFLRAQNFLSLLSYTGNETFVNCFKNGGVELFHNNSIRIQTISAGAYITGELRVSGDIIAFHSSDERLKNNIKVIDNPLNKIMGISGNTYDWNEASSHDGADTGVIAQEVEALGLPGIVTTRDDGYKAVRYERLIPLLIEAIKELNLKVKDLENKL
jgi:hypothetical protein